MNIVSTILQYLGPSLVNKVASALGMESSVTNKAVSVAIPAILSGIIGRAIEPGGAKNLQDVINRQEPGILDRLAESLGTTRQAAMLEFGRSALGSLIGVDQIGSLAGALSKFTGGSLGSANTLLSLITPGILGVLGREQKSQGLDAAGLANMLQSQKHNIASALPADFKGYLAGTKLLDAVNGKITAAEPAASTASRSTAARGKVYIPPTAPAPASDFSWPGWLVAIAAASTIWLSVFGQKLTGLVGVDRARQSTCRITGSTTVSTVGTTDVAREAMDSVDALKAALTGIRNEATARTSLTKIQDAAQRLEKVEGLATQLRPDARRRLSEMIAGRNDELRALLEAAQTAGAAVPLRPVIDEIRARLAALTKL